MGPSLFARGVSWKNGRSFRDLPHSSELEVKYGLRIISFSPRYPRFRQWTQNRVTTVCFLEAPRCFLPPNPQTLALVDSLPLSHDRASVHHPTLFRCFLARGIYLAESGARRGSLSCSPSQLGNPVAPPNTTQTVLDGFPRNTDGFSVSYGRVPTLESV